MDRSRDFLMTAKAEMSGFSYTCSYVIHISYINATSAAAPRSNATHSHARI